MCDPDGAKRPTVPHPYLIKVIRRCSGPTYHHQKNIQLKVYTADNQLTGTKR